MAAYGALVSLMHLIEQVNVYNARQPIFVVKQRILIQSLFENVIVLQEFMENYSHGGSKEFEDLESRIVDLAYAAEVIIELHIADKIQARNEETSRFNNHSASLVQKVMQNTDFIKKEIFKCRKDKEENIVTSTDPAKGSSDLLCQGLQRVIRDLDFIKKEAVKINETSGLKVQQYRDLELIGSLRPLSTGEDTVVGLDDSLIHIMDILTREQSDLQIVPITGMGGIGKTTLAKCVYDNPLIEQCFDVRSWVTISQDFDVRQMLSGLLRVIGNLTGQSEEGGLEYYDLGEKLYKHLSGRRYLIVMDDLWDIEAWDKLKLFLPDNKNRSRVIVTTRLAHVANSFGSTDLHTMNLLDENKSWSLFCSKVFVQESCPILEEIGKKIVRNCEGLPLSILVVAGLLVKSNMVREYWDYVAENVNTIVNSEDNERCLQILSLSYSHLPVHLKPCFLYMGVIPEDREIHSSELIEQWVGEGYVKPSRVKCLEEVAEDYLRDLIDRHLVLVTKFGSTGNVKFCKMHDLVRDLSLREGEKQRFFCVTTSYSPGILRSLNGQRQVVIDRKISYRKFSYEVSYALHSSSFLRSLVCDFVMDRAPSLDFRLLRILTLYDFLPPKDVIQLFNSRCLHFRLVHNKKHHLPFYTEDPQTFPSFIFLVWNLQTLVVKGNKLGIVVPSEIWEMPQLKHLTIDGVSLPDPHCGRKGRKEDEFVMENLRTLSFVLDFRCTEEVVRRIPNIKKLRTWCLDNGEMGLSHYCLNNLAQLHKLQSLVCGHPENSDHPPRTDLLQDLSFPLSLKKLTLCHCFFSDKDMTTKIGSLPLLEKLKLLDCFLGVEWSPIEGQFLRLKFLEMNDTYLKRWGADSIHFPRLEQIVLTSMQYLEDIPSDIGDIETLRLIQLKYCNDSVVASAHIILEQQRSLGNEDLCVTIYDYYGSEEENEASLARVQLYHARQPIFLDEHQRRLRSLFEKVTFLQEYLESYFHEANKEVGDLESRIIDAAYGAEVVIEFYVVDVVHARRTSHEETGSTINHPSSCLERVMQYIDSMKREMFKDNNSKEENVGRSTDPARRSCNLLLQGLKRVIRDIDFIKKEAVKINENSGLKVPPSVDPELIRSRRAPPSTGKDAVVGLDDSLIQIMDKLTREQPNLRTIPITGTGGIGKTTLAKYVYDNPYIVQCFDIRGWVTISQDYNVRQMLTDLLRAIGVLTNQSKEESFEYQLGEKLYKHLSGRRYLIVMDDMWDIEAWDKLKLYLPDNKNKSRVIVTTRLSHVANSFGSTDLHIMNLMDERKSWSLFCSKVFVQETCPNELERVGKKIVKNCNGLPLSILVIAGLLAKSNIIREYWEHVAENVSTIVNSDEDERCLRILSLSYNHLPIHLKPCFLYMGVFREDHEIRVSKLIKLWVAEGFLRPSGGKCLEEVAKDYLKDLIDRNLLYVTKFGSTGNLKYCRIHDLWRDFSLRESQKQRFLCVTAPYFSQSVNNQHRIVRRENMPYRKFCHEVSHVPWSSSFLRLTVYKFIMDQAPSLDFRLLRILTCYNLHYPEIVLRLVNSRYIHLPYTWEGQRTFSSSSICLIWNLQTLVIEGKGSVTIAPPEIWEMPQLRHVMIKGLTLPDPYRARTNIQDNEFVMENFRTLSFVLDFKCTEEVVRRIPNIKKLRMWYSNTGYTGLSRYRLQNLGRFHKLVCGDPNDKDLRPPRTDLLRYLSFPLSLKKLSLYHCYFNNKDMTTKIGPLPNLEKLELVRCRITDEWSPVEGQFLHLKCLNMSSASLKGWTAESSHFPRLERVLLLGIKELDKIPSGIGDIETLRSIRIAFCSNSIVTSAKEIVEQQRNLGNEDLRLSLRHFLTKEEL